MSDNNHANSDSYGGRKILLGLGLVFTIIFCLISLLPDDIESYGALSLLPALFLLVYIFKTKRILEALALSSMIGFIIVHRENFFAEFSNSFINVLLTEDIAWLIIVCGLMGSLVALIEKAGGAYAFGEWVSKKSKTKKSTLLWTWLLGILIFIDDYLNSLTVGSCMAPVTDKHKVSREYLAYIVDSTAAPICVLIPISTWAIFVAKLLETYGWAPQGQGVLYFIKTIPYNFYGWFGAIMVPLVILGIVPLIGPMKKAEERAQKTGVLAPPGSEKIDMKSGVSVENHDNPRIMNFFLPILFLIAATIYFDLDMLMGVIFTVGFTFVFFLAQNIISAEDFANVCVDGIKNMILPLVLICLAFLFADANEQIGFTEYIISSVSRFMTPQLMPVIIFIVMGIAEFITGTSWGMYVIALPIIIPLSQSIGANTTLCVSAILSAGVWGAHICFYSDATILSSAASGCNNYDHAITQAPFGFITAGLSAICFLIAGFII